jgi:hypothetical protein
MITKATEIAREAITKLGTVATAMRASRFFAKDGIFSNPATSPGINGEALATFVKGVWEATPTFHRIAQRR